MVDLEYGALKIIPWRPWWDEYVCMYVKYSARRQVRPSTCTTSASQFTRQNSAGNRRRISDKWIGPPGDVTTSGYLRFNRQFVSYTIVAHLITSTRACVCDLASGGNSSDKFGTSRVAPPAERTVPKSLSSYLPKKYLFLKYLVKFLRIYRRN